MFLKKLNRTYQGFLVVFKLTYQTDHPSPFVASSPYHGSCFAKQRVAVSIKLGRSGVAVFRFGVGFRRVVGVVRIMTRTSRPQGMLIKQFKFQFVKRVCSLLMVNKQ